MSNISIQKIQTDDSASNPLFNEMHSLTERIRQKAYDLFQQRGGENGSALEDWLKAEKELFGETNSELVERDGRFEVQIAVPGFTAEDVHVTALPDALIVRGEATHQSNGSKDDVYLSEYGEKSLFRKVDLPAPINVDQVTAKLDHGVLKVAASKAA